MRLIHAGSFQLSLLPISISKKVTVDVNGMGPKLAMNGLRTHSSNRSWESVSVNEQYVLSIITITFSSLVRDLQDNLVGAFNHNVHWSVVMVDVPVH